MAPHIALLRGVNVGGNNTLPMRDLAALFVAAGGAGARTFIQSGNVVFDVDPASVSGVCRAVGDAIAERFGFTTTLVVRSLPEWRAAMAARPFADEAHTHVYFLADVPPTEAVARLDPDRSPGDRFAVVGREVFLWLPDGVARTKLTNAWLDRALGTVSTGRNWRTVCALAAMANEAG